MMTPSKFLSNACAYCGATSALRIAGTDCHGRPDDFICADCFTGTNTGPSFDDLPLAPSLLQKLASSETLSAYLTVWVLVEQELNTLRLNGFFDEADAGQAEFDRITAEVGPRLRRQDYDSIRTYSLAEMAELSKPITLSDVTSMVCADILSGALGSYGRVA